jgi:glycosyltransferase involved in cell wall biosynthesis
MRILHITPALDQGGAEKLLHELVKANPENDHFIVKLLAGEDFFCRDVRDRCVDLNLSRNRFVFLLRMPHTLIKLGILCYRIRPDVVVGWLYYGALLASIGAIMGVPTIWTIHANEVRPFRASVRMAAWLCARLSRKVPEAIHYCSVEGRVAHEQFGFHSEVSMVIFNGVNVERYAEISNAAPPAVIEDPANFESILETTRRRNPRSTMLGCVARFHLQKDHETLLRAMAILAAQGRSFHLVLAGDGCVWHNQEFAGMIDRFGLRDRVIALGAVPNIERLYQYLDCIVLSSAYGESMPLCLLEALAAGKPVVATDVGATREIIGPFGIATPPLSAPAFADAIVRVAWGSDPYKSSARLLAPAYVQNEYGLQQWVFKWERLLNEASVARAQRGKTKSIVEGEPAAVPEQVYTLRKYDTP